MIGLKMKILTKKNLVKFLVRYEAHQSYLTWAQSQASARDIVEKCLEDQYLDWLILIIGGPLWNEYYDKRAPFLAGYNNQIATLLAECNKYEAKFWAEYINKVDLLWAEFDNYEAKIYTKYCGKITPLRAEYWEKRTLLWAEYYKKRTTFYAEYKHKQVPIWAEHKNKVAKFWAEYREKCYTIAKELCTFERIQEAIGI